MQCLFLLCMRLLNNWTSLTWFSLWFSQIEIIVFHNLFPSNMKSSRRVVVFIQSPNAELITTVKTKLAVATSQQNKRVLLNISFSLFESWGYYLSPRFCETWVRWIREEYEPPPGRGRPGLAPSSCIHLLAALRKTTLFRIVS